MLTAEKTQDLPTESKKPPATDDVQRPATDDVPTPAADDVQSPATDDVQSPATDDVPTPATDDVQSPATDDVQTVEPLKVIHVHHSLTAAGITTCTCPSGFLPVTLHSFLPPSRFLYQSPPSDPTTSPPFYLFLLSFPISLFVSSLHHCRAQLLRLTWSLVTLLLEVGLRGWCGRGSGREWK